MTLLGIETATTVCAAAVMRDGVLLAEELVDERNVHAEKLLTMVDTAFQLSGSTLEQMDGIAVSIGPGSFTGLRIGLSVAKGLAFASGKPILPVPTLLGMAAKAAGAPGEENLAEYVLPLLDARRGDVYCALYRRHKGELLQEWEPRVMTLDGVAEAVRTLRVLVTGDARHALEHAVHGRFPESARNLRIATDHVAQCSAAAVARIGELLLRQGRSADPALLEPEYLRDFHTTTH